MNVRSPLGGTAIDGVSFDIARGDTYGLLGPNGAGKTTLFRCMTGLTRADGGSVLVRGRDICRIRGRALRAARQEMALIFQQFNLVRRLTAHHNVLAGRLAHVPAWRVVSRRFARADRQRALACLDAVGLLERAWILLNARGLAVQPFYVVTDALRRSEGNRLPGHLTADARVLQERAAQIFPPGESLHMLLRAGTPLRAPVRARRLPLVDLCVDRP